MKADAQAVSKPFHPLVAGALVFYVSGTVLVIEILAARLLAPYVGLSLETYTAIIGVVLAGISAGTWVGGRLADVFDPRRILGPLLVVGGLLSLTTIPAVRYFGDVAEGRSWYALGLATGLSFFLPTAVLSSAHPQVVKLQLRSLARTGRVVGRLSALGTAGAIAGTFLTGFVLLPSFPTSDVVLVLGASLATLGAVLTAAGGRGGRVLAVVSVIAMMGLAAAVARGKGRCEVETAYFCANVTEVSPDDPSRRIMKLDTLLHGYVDVDDPRFFGFPYVQRIADLTDVFRPKGRPIDALHIGGGGFSIPRYVAASRPRSTNVVLELDPDVVELAKERLALRTGPRMQVRIGDARVTVRDLPDHSYDLATGDAFAGVSIPWHLTTREALEDVRRTLRANGIYAMNLIDHPPLDFLRAEARTLEDVFRHVGLVSHPSFQRGVIGSTNYVLLGSDAPLPTRALRARISGRRGGDALTTGPPLDRFIGDAALLTDDYAPADQLLTR